MGLTRFPERAVKALVDTMSKSEYGPRCVRDVLKYDNVDVSAIEPFLSHAEPLVRAMALEVIISKGDVKKAVGQIAVEKDKRTLLGALKLLDTKAGREMEKLVHLIDSEDIVVRMAAINAFRKCRRCDCLFTLLFDKDDSVMRMVKKYIEEEDANAEKERSEEEPRMPSTDLPRLRLDNEDRK